MTAKQIQAELVAALCRVRFVTLPKYLKNEAGENLRHQRTRHFAKLAFTALTPNHTPKQLALFIAVVVSQLRADYLLD